MLEKPKLLSLRNLFAVGFVFLMACYTLMSARILEPFSGAIDLGRHLRDGEFLLSSSAWQVLHSNFYSYTYPEAPFVDHHWLASIVFFVVWKCAGFVGLNIFYIAVGAITFLIFFRIAYKAVGFPLSFAIALPLIPIVRARSAVRPEIFTFLLCAIFFWLLWRDLHRSDAPGWKTLLLFGGLQVLWVNLHSGFVFGPFFVGAFLLGELLEPRKWDGDKLARVQRLSLILVVTIVACLVNPSGIRGALYPYTLLMTKQFPVLENFTVSDVESRGAPIESLSIRSALVLLGLSFVIAAWKRKFVLPLFILGGTIAILTWEMYRNHPVLGLLTLAIAGINAGLCEVQQIVRDKRIAVGLLSVAILGGCYVTFVTLDKEKQGIGFGMKPAREATAQFFLTNHIQGPILNNFNIGGYLIYYLFPQHRVYLDSRAEAYPSEFMVNGYILPMQSEQEWQRLFSAYQFNAIVFCWSSDWEDGFIARRMQDHDWTAVHVDGGSTILVRRAPQNQNLISLFEIPRDKLPLVRQ